ncbi:MAG: protein-L-isoaspartate(D-aspartate) O-methyltransferase [Candidatus Krumholzibacteria bacterium]|nr:protein-L-isoaspartate(D-aspartate) O-methyltransferase [Candidatus Krumholzibacteria bacterium]
MALNDYRIARRRMVEEQLMARGIRDERILAAFLEVPRHLFVDPAVGGRAYDDCSLPIGCSQTISQPYTQAMMMQEVGVRSGDRVLEIGTGSGYQTAILSLIAREVCSIERIAALSESAEAVLKRVRTGRIRLKVGDGAEGWPYYSPFDRIIVSAATRERPDALLGQLSDSGSLIAPLQTEEEQLVLYRRTGNTVTEKRLTRCSFVPMLKGVG